MRVCELKQKEVINICTCKTLGCPLDVEFDCCTGQIEMLIVPVQGKMCGFFGSVSEYVIPFFLYPSDWRGHYSGGNSGGKVFEKRVRTTCEYMHTSCTIRKRRGL